MLEELFILFVFVLYLLFSLRNKGKLSSLVSKPYMTMAPTCKVYFHMWYEVEETLLETGTFYGTEY